MVRKVVNPFFLSLIKQVDIRIIIPNSQALQILSYLANHSRWKSFTVAKINCYFAGKHLWLGGSLV